MLGAFQARGGISDCGGSRTKPGPFLVFLISAGVGVDLGRTKARKPFTCRSFFMQGSRSCSFLGVGWSGQSVGLPLVSPRWLEKGKVEFEGDADFTFVTPYGLRPPRFPCFCCGFVPQTAFSTATYWCVRDVRDLLKSGSAENRRARTGVDVKIGSSSISSSWGRP
eukprot:scaffold44_cov339-Pavlova_lutheri.AAC.57